jgi:hypothetical protein
MLRLRRVKQRKRVVVRREVEGRSEVGREGGREGGRESEGQRIEGGEEGHKSGKARDVCVGAAVR